MYIIYDIMTFEDAKSFSLAFVKHRLLLSLLAPNVYIVMRTTTTCTTNTT